MIAETGKFSASGSNAYWGKANLKINRQTTSEPQLKAPAEERRLIERLRRKKSSAFLDLYDRYQGIVFRFLLHMTGNETTAEELTQELFVSILKGIEKDGVLSNFNAEKGCLEGYLIGFARNLARRSHFQGQRWTSLESAHLESAQELAYRLSLRNYRRGQTLIACVRPFSVCLLPTAKWWFYADWRRRVTKRLPAFWTVLGAPWRLGLAGDDCFSPSG
jgi:hypothetical protein